MAKVSPHGRVIQGDYNGYSIYIWYEKEMLKIVYDSYLYTKLLGGEPDHREAARICRSTVERYQLINAAEKPFSYAEYDVASFLYGPMAASQALKDTLYTVAIYFKDGKKCVAELNSAAYNTLTSACFVL